jgi:protoporphyrin/coproporphyrin ferrochelatase
MATAYDAVLLIAFGGPTAMHEVRPFLDNVLRGRPVPPERLEEVVHHYELIGGASPITALTERQAAALCAALPAAGLDLPVYVGMRNWHPLLPDTLATMADHGVRRAVGFIMSAQQSEPGWDRYVNDVQQARAAVGARAPLVEQVDNWHDHPRFIDTVCARIEEAVTPLPRETRDNACTVFTAHSIPVAAAERGPYVSQLEHAMGLIAKQVGLPRVRLAYQSRSGNPREPWLEPDILEVVRALAAEGSRTAVVVPLGFVCDHVEVLYDLDIEARALAESLGLRFVRALAPNDHPSFVRMMVEVIASHVRRH